MKFPINFKELFELITPDDLWLVLGSASLNYNKDEQPNHYKRVLKLQGITIRWTTEYQAKMKESQSSAFNIRNYHSLSRDEFTKYDLLSIIKCLQDFRYWWQLDFDSFSGYAPYVRLMNNLDIPTEVIELIRSRDPKIPFVEDEDRDWNEILNLVKEIASRSILYQVEQKIDQNLNGISANDLTFAFSDYNLDPILYELVDVQKKILRIREYLKPFLSDGENVYLEDGKEYSEEIINWCKSKCQVDITSNFYTIRYISTKVYLINCPKILSKDE